MLLHSGSCIIAALLEARNCLAVENNPVLFIQSKVRVVDRMKQVSSPPKEASPSSPLATNDCHEMQHEELCADTEEELRLGSS